MHTKDFAQCCLDTPGSIYKIAQEKPCAMLSLRLQARFHKKKLCFNTLGNADTLLLILYGMPLGTLLFSSQL